MYPAPVSPVPNRQECIRIGQWARGLGVRNYGTSIARWSQVFPSGELLKIALARLIYASVPLRPHPVYQSAEALFAFANEHVGESPPDGPHQITTRLVTEVPGGHPWIRPRRYVPSNAFFMWGALATWANYDLGNVPNAWAFFDYANTWRANPPDPADFAAQCALTPPDRDRRWDLIFGRQTSPDSTSAEMGTNGGQMPFINGPSSKGVIGPAAPHL